MTPGVPAAVADVDVIVPAYNAAATVDEAIASLQHQTLRAIRIVVVDDGSTDDTGDRLRARAASDPRILVVARPNGGIVDALNQALALCTAPLVARHDADDIAHPERLARQKAYLDANPDCVAVGANVAHIDAAGSPTGTFSEMRSPDLADPFCAPSIEPYIIHPMLTARRGALLAIGGYRHVWHAEDTDLYWRLSAMGRLHNLDDVLGDYRLHGASISSRSMLNGRISALNAQLAAVSHRRRMAGRPDLSFPRERLAGFEDDGSLRRMVARLAPELDVEERRYVELATAAKLMELLTYRPYRLDAGDWLFLRRNVQRNLALVPTARARRLDREQVWLAARMIVQGELLGALVATPARFYLPAFWHLGAGKIRKLVRWPTSTDRDERRIREP